MLLDEFRKLPGHVERPRTFMEIAGYPHYENVCSNILAFYMDPEESHGLGTLVLDALLSFGNGTELNKAIGSSVSVEREVNTDRGRIDLLITSDDQAILIENKIHASARNPFDDYAAYLHHTADGRTKHKFLLTLYPTNEGSEWGFANLTHKEFVGEIRSLLGNYVADANTRYLTMFLDFLNTLGNLRRGTRMDKEFVKLLVERSEDIERLLAEVKSFRKELRQKIRDLGALIEVEKYSNVEQWFYREEPYLYDCLVHDILVEGLPVHIDTTIYPGEWEISIGLRKGDFSKLEQLLQHLEITFKEGEDRGYSENFAYDADLDVIRAKLQKLIDKLAKYQGA